MRKAAMILAMLAALCAPAPASAAVLLCEKPVLGDLVEAATELDARKAAISSWTKKIAHLGEPYSSWRLARAKRYECAPLASGKWTCAAFAAPCTIRQKPPELHQPPGKPPKKPGEAA